MQKRPVEKAAEVKAAVKATETKAVVKAEEVKAEAKEVVAKKAETVVKKAEETVKKAEETAKKAETAVKAAAKTTAKKATKKAAAKKTAKAEKKELVPEVFVQFDGNEDVVATELKKRKANRIFVVATFGLFTNGLEKFDKAVEDGTIYRVVTTNLTYQTPELLSRPYYINCDMSKYIAYIIDTLNHDASISELLDPNERIQKLIKKYKANQKKK